MSRALYIVVPYRDREEHLSRFVPYMNIYLSDIPHQIVVAEQFDKKPFNRGKLLNIGFDYSRSLQSDPFYVALHDIDMLPIDQSYHMPDQPTQLATKAEQFDWKMPYPGYFGGVTLFLSEHFLLVNGYSNEYWGWGAEDDDFRRRCVLAGLKPQLREGRYKSLPHPHPDQTNLHNNRVRLQTPATVENRTVDGLSSLTYNLVEVIDNGDYIHLKAEI